MGQGTKVKPWKIVVTKVGVLSFVTPDIKHSSLFIDFILTLECGQVDESVSLHTLKLGLHRQIT